MAKTIAVALMVALLATIAATPATAQEDTDPPEITAWSPAQGERNVGLKTNPSVTLNEPLHPTTVNDNTVELCRKPPGKSFWVVVAATMTLENNVIHIDPVNKLRRDTKYQTFVSDGVADLAGNHLDANYGADWRTRR